MLRVINLTDSLNRTYDKILLYSPNLPALRQSTKGKKVPDKVLKLYLVLHFQCSFLLFLKVSNKYILIVANCVSNVNC